MEVGRIAVSTKGVEGGDQEAEGGRVRDGERESTSARGETRNGGRKLEEERRRRRGEAGEGRGTKRGRSRREPSNLHPATAPDLGRTNH